VAAAAAAAAAVVFVKPLILLGQFGCKATDCMQATFDVRLNTFLSPGYERSWHSLPLLTAQLSALHVIPLLLLGAYAQSSCAPNAPSPTLYMLEMVLGRKDYYQSACGSCSCTAANTVCCGSNSMPLQQLLTKTSLQTRCGVGICDGSQNEPCAPVHCIAVSEMIWQTTWCTDTSTRQPASLAVNHHSVCYH